MKTVLTIAFFAFLGFGNKANAQTPHFLWAKQLGGGYIGEGNSIAVDANGNVYTTGIFYATSDFDPGPGTYYLTPVSGHDVFVSKLDASGNFVWAKQWGRGEGKSIAVDADGNVYTTGYFLFTCDFDPNPDPNPNNGVYNLTASGFDVFISKLDPNGNFLWARKLGGPQNDYGYSIAFNAIGNVTTTGYFQGTVDFDPGSGTNNLTAAGQDVFISTLDASGNFLWARQFGGSGDDIGTSVSVDANGNVYTTGHFQGSVDFDPGTGTSNLNAAGSADIFISKLSPSGNFIWAKQLGGTTWDSGVSIAVDTSQNIYSIGTFQGIADFDPGTGTFILTGNTGFNNSIFVSKLSASGNFIWANQMGESATDTGNDIAVNVNGNVYTIGRNFQASLNTDIHVTKFDASGNVISDIQMGGPGADEGNSITADAIGNIYLTGYFEYTADLDPGNETYTLVSTSNHNEIFVEKLCNIETPTISSLGTLCQGGSTILTSSMASSYLWSNGETTQSIEVTDSGNYSVVVFNSSGCSAVSTITTVFPNPLPTASITPTSATITCAAPSATLTSSGGGTYSWSNGLGTNPTVTVTPASTTTYTVTVTTNGCTDTESVTVIVNNALPTASVTPTSATITCAVPSATLIASGGGTYSWSNGLGTTPTVTIAPASTTTYTVTLTATNGCTDTESVTVIVNNALPTASITPTSATITCAVPSATLTTSGGGTYSWSNGLGTNPIVTVTLASTTTYTVTVTSTNGCTDTEIITVTVDNTPPSATINPIGSVSICSGDSVTLTANPTGSYLWSTGATMKSIMVSTTGNYTVHVTAINGCSAVSAPTTVTVHPLPPMPIIFPLSQITILCESDSAELTSSSANTYSWNTGASTQSIIVSAAGDYSVVITDINGCTAASIPKSVSCIVGASEAALPEAFNISPNPSSGIFTVEFFLPEAKTVAQRVLNGLGQAVWVAAPGLETGKFRREIILTTAVMPGIYLLETRLDGRAFLRKIVVR